MPLHIDRAAIAARQQERASHEVTLDRAARRDADRADSKTTQASAGQGDVALDVRGLGSGHPELEHIEQAEAMTRQLRGTSIAALQGAHAGVDPQRAAALLTP